MITLIHVNYILMVMNEKVFLFLASVFHSHVVYLVNEVTDCHYFFFNLYIRIKDYIAACSHSKRQMVIIETTFYLILMNFR